MFLIFVYTHMAAVVCVASTMCEIIYYRICIVLQFQFVLTESYFHTRVPYPSIFSQRKPSLLVGEPILGLVAPIRSWRWALRGRITTCWRLPFRVPGTKNRTRAQIRRTEAKDSTLPVRISIVAPPHRD